MRKCPMCESTDSKLIYKQKYSASFSQRISTCLKCGFVFVTNVKQQKFFNKFYKDMSIYEQTRDEAFHIESAKIINDYAKKTDRILDVGCSIGHLLYLLKQNKYKNLSGFDPSPSCCLVAKEKYNLNIGTATIDSFQPKKKYDFIILATVLEHLVNLSDSLQKIRSMHSINGKVFISVPNASQAYEKVEEPFYEFSPEHINFFSTWYINKLMEGYTCLYLRSDPVVIYSVWKKSEVLKSNIERYITESKTKLSIIKKIIQRLPNKIIVWGAGALTKRLLYSTNLKKKIFKFVDKNANLAGTKIEGIEVLSPDQLVKYKNPILVSSFKFKKEIIDQIKEMGLKNSIITF
ncbi:methyltransferase domain-containing protein [Candidatus Roizmanbacteria bacterium]|nr:methyltransferase domain-containing protein [Candidatus Roizmanbacteria bacterium]